MFDTYLPLLLILPLTYRKESGSMQESVVYFFFVTALSNFRIMVIDVKIMNFFFNDKQIRSISFAEAILWKWP